MSTRFPATGIDDNTTLPNPSATNTTNSPSHSSLHANANDAIKAVETKLGTGAATPASNTLLFGTGAGTSAWQGLTSAQLASVLSDETGTGSVVFANTPTLITPKVDTINEATTGNGTTIGGVNIKAGALNTNNSVVTANITDAAITASKLANSAITLGYTEITADFTTTAVTTATDVTGLTVTVTVPTGGRRIKITAWCGSMKSSGGAATTVGMGIVEGSTLLKQTIFNTPVSGYNEVATCIYVGTPISGSHTYKVQVYQGGAGTLTLQAAGPSFASNFPGPAFILVEAA